MWQPKSDTSLTLDPYAELRGFLTAYRDNPADEIWPKDYLSRNGLDRWRIILKKDGRAGDPIRPEDAQRALLSLIFMALDVMTGAEFAPGTVDHWLTQCSSTATLPVIALVDTARPQWRLDLARRSERSMDVALSAYAPLKDSLTPEQLTSLARFHECGPGLSAYGVLFELIRDVLSESLTGATYWNRDTARWRDSVTDRFKSRLTLLLSLWNPDDRGGLVGYIAAMFTAARSQRRGKEMLGLTRAYCNTWLDEARSEAWSYLHVPGPDAWPRGFIAASCWCRGLGEGYTQIDWWLSDTHTADEMTQVWGHWSVMATAWPAPYSVRLKVLEDTDISPYADSLRGNAGLKGPARLVSETNGLGHQSLTSFTGKISRDRWVRSQLEDTLEDVFLSRRRSAARVVYGMLAALHDADRADDLTMWFRAELTLATARRIEHHRGGFSTETAQRIWEQLITRLQSGESQAWISDAGADWLLRAFWPTVLPLLEYTAGSSPAVKCLVPRALGLQLVSARNQVKSLGEHTACLAELIAVGLGRDRVDELLGDAPPIPTVAGRSVAFESPAGRCIVKLAREVLRLSALLENQPSISDEDLQALRAIVTCGLSKSEISSHPAIGVVLRSVNIELTDETKSVEARLRS
ncbi:MAG: hypothetical protein ACKVVP_02605, partial [Chloroflexota bacterium]